MFDLDTIFNPTAEPTDSDLNQSYRGLLERLNTACPPDWTPTAADWLTLDGIESRIADARARSDLPAHQAALADYESVARESFTSCVG